MKKLVALFTALVFALTLGVERTRRRLGSRSEPWPFISG